MKFYQVMFPHFLAPAHLAINDEGKTLCGKDWKYNLQANINELSEGWKLRETVGCMRCILAYRKKYELADAAQST